MDLNLLTSDKHKTITAHNNSSRTTWEGQKYVYQQQLVEINNGYGVCPNIHESIFRHKNVDVQYYVKLNFLGTDEEFIKRYNKKSEL